MSEFYKKTLDEQKAFLTSGIKKILGEIKNEIGEKKDFNPEKIQAILDKIKEIKSKKELYKLMSDIEIKGKNARSYFIDGKFNKIGLNKEHFNYHNNYGILLLLYHELTHAIGRDYLYELFPGFKDFILRYFYKNKVRLRKKFFNPKTYNFKTDEEIILYISRENYTKIVSFRKYMIDHKYKLDKNGIEKLFNFIEKEILKKQNKLFQVEEGELFYIYERFKEKKEDLLFFLQNLVKLEDLKKEVYYV